MTTKDKTYREVSNLKRDIEERVSQYHPGLPYKDLPPSLQKRADGLTNDIINLIESVVDEIIGADEPHDHLTAEQSIQIIGNNQLRKEQRDIKSKLIGKE